MKHSILIVTILFVLPCTVSAQRIISIEQEEEPYGADIFSKKTWNYNLAQSFEYNTYGITHNDREAGSSSPWNFDLEANYFVADHFAVGGRLAYRGERYKYESDAIYRNCRSMAFLNALYGRRLGDRVNFLMKGSVGLGMDNFIYKDHDGETNTSSRSVFGAEIGAGIPIEIAGSFHLTPFLGYRYESASDDDYLRKQNGLFLELNVDLFFPCGEFFCDIGNDFSSPSPRYEQGTAVIGSRAFGMFTIGEITEEIEGDEGTLTFEEDFSRISLMGSGYYYVVDKVAIGAGLEWSSATDKAKDSDNRSSDHQYLVMPMVVLHTPVENAAENLFLEAGYGIGQKISKTGPEDDTDKVQFLVQKFSVGIGYHYFITRKTALTPFIHYASISEKNQDTDIRTVYSGLNTGIAWNVFF